MPNTHITLTMSLTPHMLEKYFGFTDEEIECLRQKTPRVIDFEKLQAKAAGKRGRR